MTELPPLDNEELQKFLPHRAPFLMVDRILGIQLPPHVSALNRLPVLKELVGTRSTGLKNITRNEWFFQGHFPGFAVFPGVLIAETMAQVSSFCLYPSVMNAPEEFAKKYRFFLAGLDGIRFKKPVLPGDSLKIETELKTIKGPVCFFEAVATVDSVKVAYGELIANMFSLEGKS